MPGTVTGSQPKAVPPGRPRVAVAEATTATARAPVPGPDGPAPAPPLRARVSATLPGTRPAGVRSPQGLAGPSLLEAQVAYLHRVTPGLNLATAFVCLIFGAFWVRSGPEGAWVPWLALGAASVLLRLLWQFAFRLGAASGLRPEQARRHLVLTIVAACAGGAMLGWGWSGLVPSASAGVQDLFLMVQVGLLLWSLHALRPCLPAFLGFAAFSLAPAFGWSTGLLGSASGGPVGTLSLSLLTLSVVALAVRVSRDFHAGLRLQQRVQGLLEEVMAKRDEALRATQAKSRFLASVSHDLRQPMYAVNLYLSTVSTHFERLLANPADRTSVRGVQEGIRRLQDSTVYLNSMFESLLSISRLNAGRVDAQIRYTTLVGMLEQLRSDYSRQAASQGLSFEVRLPPQFALMEVETDPALLERLLRNLLVNAFRYTLAGGVRLSVVARDRSLDFRVVDTGPGIERSMRARVFEEFFQVPSAETGAQDLSASPASPAASAEEPSAEEAGAPLAGRGIGLGLAISARLADTLGSRVRLHSHLGQGSVFAFRQPMRVALRPTAGDRPAARADDLELPPQLFVAVIDDDREILQATRQLLEARGVEVFTATAVSQAVQRLGAMGRRPDLLLSDYRMSPENGIQAIAMLREEFNHDIPALLITGDTSPDQLEEFGRMGLEVLYKPVSAPELFRAMRRVLQQEGASTP